MQRVPLMLLPTIGLEGAGAIVSVNFGCCPFRYQPPDERPSLLPNKAMHRRERSEGQALPQTLHLSHAACRAPHAACRMPCTAWRMAHGAWHNTSLSLPPASI
jgi:hypothetical protein